MNTEQSVPGTLLKALHEVQLAVVGLVDLVDGADTHELRSPRITKMGWGATPGHKREGR